MLRASCLCCFRERMAFNSWEESPSLESEKTKEKNQEVRSADLLARKTIVLAKGKLSRGNCYSEKLKPAEAIFTDDLAGGFIIDIDEHVFFRMTGEVAGEDFYKLLFLTRGSLHEPFSHVKPMRSFATIESKPVMQTVGTELIQPGFVLRHTCLNLFKTQTLS